MDKRFMVIACTKVKPVKAAHTNDWVANVY